MNDTAPAPSLPDQGVRLLDLLTAFRSAELELRRRARARYGMGESDLLALQYLLRRAADGAAVRASELGEYLSVSTPSTTALLDRLERSGYVERKPDPDDRRAINIVPVPAALGPVRGFLEDLHERLAAVGAGLPGEEAAVVERYLGELTATLETLPASDDLKR